MGWAQRCDDIHIMPNITHIKRSTLTIFEPFLRGLVTSDIKLPCDERHIRKILSIIKPNFTNAVIYFVRLKANAVFGRFTSNGIISTTDNLYQALWFVRQALVTLISEFDVTRYQAPLTAKKYRHRWDGVRVGSQF